MAERAGIEPAINGVIRSLLVLKTSWNTSSYLSTESYVIFPEIRYLIKTIDLVREIESPCNL